MPENLTHTVYQQQVAPKLKDRQQSGKPSGRFNSVDITITYGMPN